MVDSVTWACTKSFTCGGLSSKWVKVPSLACLSSKIRDLSPLWGFDWHGVVFNSMVVELGEGKFPLLCFLIFVVGVGGVCCRYPSMVFDTVGRTHLDFLLYLALDWVDTSLHQ